MIGTSIGLLLGFLAIGIPVAVALILLALALGGLFSPMPLTSVFGELAWSTLAVRHQVDGGAFQLHGRTRHRFKSMSDGARSTTLLSISIRRSSRLQLRGVPYADAQRSTGGAEAVHLIDLNSSCSNR